MKELTVSTGVVEMQVNGKRIIRFNPSDIGFLETLYGLLGKIEAIDTDTQKKKDKAAELAKLFDMARSADKRMRDAVDTVFGEGFCDDVFDGVRLVALADGLTVIENLIFSVVDEMDESVRENISKRDEKISKYTAKYQNYRR